jgi:hypothetical protein
MLKQITPTSRRWSAGRKACRCPRAGEQAAERIADSIELPRRNSPGASRPIFQGACADLLCASGARTLRSAALADIAGTSPAYDFRRPEGGGLSGDALTVRGAAGKADGPPDLRRLLRHLIMVSDAILPSGMALSSIMYILPSMPIIMIIFVHGLALSIMAMVLSSMVVFISATCRPASHDGHSLFHHIVHGSGATRLLTMIPAAPASGSMHAFFPLHCLVVRRPSPATQT